MPQELEPEFHAKMIEVYDRARSECGYTASRFLQYVSSNGGLKAAKMLLASKHFPDGLTELWKAGRLDISMEALVLSEPWCKLFTENELAIARKRLKDLGYKGF